MSDVVETWLSETPTITKFWFLAAGSLTLGLKLGIINLLNMPILWTSLDQVLKNFEIWRVISSGCLSFPIEHHIGYGMATYAQTVLVYRWVAMLGLILVYGGSVEHFVFKRNKIQFMIFVLFCIGCLKYVHFYQNFKEFGVYGDCLAMCMVSLFGLRWPDAEKTMMFQVFTFKAMFAFYVLHVQKGDMHALCYTLTVSAIFVLVWNLNLVSDTKNRVLMNDTFIHREGVHAHAPPYTFIQPVKNADTKMELEADLSHKNFSDILVLFQYNWAPNLRVTTKFLRKWKQFSKKIVLAVPKPVPEELYSIQSDDVKILEYDGDGGFVSPLKNLVKVVGEINGENNSLKTPIKGILQLHDDMLVNLTTILSDSDWKNTVFTSGFKDMGNNFTLKSGPVTPKWLHWRPEYGLEAMEAAENKIISKSHEFSNKLSRSDTSEILWFIQSQSDFIYLPEKSFDLACQMGEWLSSTGVMIEIAYPMIVQNLAFNGFQVKGLDLCTNWNKMKRTQVEEMARLCRLGGMHEIDLFHPVKPGLEVIDSAWIKWFDKMTEINY